MDTNVCRKVANTLAVIRELAKGKRIAVPGYTLAMGEDFSIGPQFTKLETGEEFIIGDATFKQLVDLFGEIVIIPEV
jgi:hypothetical protein